MKHEVTSDFIVEAVETFFQLRVLNRPDWINGVRLSLKDELLDLIKECGVGENTPSYIVDNFLIKGDFVSRENDKEIWLENVDLKNENGEDLEAIELDDVLDTAWNNYCTTYSLIFNDEYACLKF